MQLQSPLLTRRNSIAMLQQVTVQTTVPPTATEDLRDLHDHIKTKIQQWDRLMQSHKHKQQQSFVRVFNNVLDRMKADLKEAQEKLQSIDMLALADQHNTRLQRELHFFREECVLLHSKLDEAAKDIAILKKDNEQLKEEVTSLQSYLKGHRTSSKSKHRQKGAPSSRRVIANTNVPALPNEEEIALMGLIQIIKSERPEAGIDLLRTFLKNEVIRCERAPTPCLQPSTPQENSHLKYLPTRQLRLQSVDWSSQYQTKQNFSVNLQPKHNEALEIWQECVKSAKSRDHHLPKFLAKESKFRLLEKFFGSERLIELLRRLLFGERCCNNFNCLYNIAANRPEPAIPEESFRNKGTTFQQIPQTADQQPRRYWSKIRRRSVQKPGVSLGSTFADT